MRPALSFFKGIFAKNREAFPVHFVISDLENKKHKTAQTVERKLGGMAGYDSKQIFSGDFILKIEGKTKFHLIAKPKHFPGLSLDLFLSGKDSDLLLHGDQGKSIKSRKNPNIYSYYYSIPGLSTQGELTLDGKKILIENGNSWMDHEWSSPFDSTRQAELSDKFNSWDWICIQLEDGSNIMAFNFRETSHSPSESFGTIRLKSGKKHISNKKETLHSYMILLSGKAQEQIRNTRSFGIFILILLKENLNSILELNLFSKTKNSIPAPPQDLVIGKVP